MSTAAKHRYSLTQNRTSEYILGHVRRNWGHSHSLCAAQATSVDGVTHASRERLFAPSEGRSVLFQELRPVLFSPEQKPDLHRAGK
jgi:hypothetical protein